MFGDLIESWNGLLEGRELPPHLKAEARAKQQQTKGQEAAANRGQRYDTDWRRAGKAREHGGEAAVAKARARSSIAMQPRQSPMGKKVRAFKKASLAKKPWEKGGPWKPSKSQATASQKYSQSRQDALARAHHDAGGGPYR